MIFFLFGLFIGSLYQRRSYLNTTIYILKEKNKNKNKKDSLDGKNEQVKQR